MKHVTLTKRLRYQFDNTMSKGTIALISWLLVVSIVFIMAASLLVFLAGIVPSPEGDTPPGFLDIVWLSLMRTLDSGAVGGDTGSWSFLLAMLGVTMGGIFIVSTLIGVLTSGIESKLEELRKGRSMVIEEGHTAILGWSPHIFTILTELVTANANQAHACIAILANKDKIEMEDEIRDKVGHTGRTRIVCRTGNPIDLTDLEIINPHNTRSIIVLAPEDTLSPDSYIIKAVLALTNNPNRRATPYHIIAEMREPKNIDVLRMVGKNEVEPILVSDLISRITVQTCRQSGLSVVYTELLDFGGDEIYFCREPALAGRTFAEALLAYDNSAVIGMCFADGRVQLNPPMITKLETGDQLIVISEDDDTIRLSNRQPDIQAELIHQAQTQEAQPERTLILGWNHRAPVIIRELDQYVAPGSEVTIVADVPQIEVEAAGPTQHMKISFHAGDTTNRPTLDNLDIAGYQHVIVLSYSDTMDPQDADSQTLITLLHLRAIAEQVAQPFSIVSEMLDVRNRELAEITRADDFIVSDKLISLLLTQVSENKQLAPVFADLFDPEGCELYLKPAGDYIELGQPLNFYTVVEAARLRGEVALGYRLRALAGDAGQFYGVRVNPTKSNTITFAAEDRIIVLAES